MRKTALAAVIASAVVITLGGTTALAFGHSGQNGYQNNVVQTADMVYNQNSKCEYCDKYGHHYTDADNDGICDHYTSNASNTGSYCRYGDYADCGARHHVDHGIGSRHNTEHSGNGNHHSRHE